MAFLFRILAAVAVVGAVAYGVYVGYYSSVITGLIWIASALTLGWVGNMIFNLVYVLASAGAGPLVKANYRNRPQHSSFGARKSR